MPLIGLAYLGFISLGLPDGLLGVAWPSMRGQFGVPLGAAGFLVAGGTVGYVLSSVTAGFLLSRWGVGMLLAGSTGLAGLGLAGLSVSPALPVAICATLVLGLGSGAIDSGLNAYAAANFSARHMNLLHAAFGFGAMLGPLVMTAALATSASWRGGYATVAILQAILATAFALSARRWGRGSAAAAAVVSAASTPASGQVGAGTAVSAAVSGGAGTAAGSGAAGQVGAGTAVSAAGQVGAGTAVSAAGQVGAGTAVSAAVSGGAGTAAAGGSGVGGVGGGENGGAVTGGGARSTFRSPAVWLGVAMFGVYTGLEIAAGLWAYTLLTEARGLDPAVAGICVSAYWGSLFAGRLLLGLFGDGLSPVRLVWLGLAGVGAGVLLLILPFQITSVIGLMMIGFCAAPVFPMLTLITSQRVGAEHADRAVGMQMGSAGLFGTLIPAGVGVLIGRLGGDVLGPALAVLTVVMLALYFWDRSRVDLNNSNM